jgi:cytochrome P450
VAAHPAGGERGTREGRRAILAPGPRQRFPGEFTIAAARRPLEFLTSAAREYGDVVGFPLGGRPAVLLAHPDDIRDVLVTNGRCFHKGRGLERAKLLLGEGLLTSEDEFHLRQRRLASPAFHRARVDAYGDTMAAYARRRAESWQGGATLDISREMAAYTLAVVGKTLFDADIEAEAHEIGDALSASLAAFNFMTLPFGELLMRLPLPAVRRFERGRDRLDATIYRMIAERRASGEDRGDLLSMLLLAQDTEGDGSGMSDLQLRDEAMTLLLAGHETTANALSWTWYMLSQHPEVEARLHDEVDALGARSLGAGDVARLPYTRAVLAETMRLYPPAWVIGRRALVDYPVRDHVIRANSLVLVSQWVTHRDPRWWSEAESFQPERWRLTTGGQEVRESGGQDGTNQYRRGPTSSPSDIHSIARPRLSYFPFGAGTRVCVGEQFAWMEAILALATFAQRWRLRLVPGHPVAPQPIVTLRMRHGLRMTVHAR